METLAGEGKFQQAAEIADVIPWKKVRSVNTLITAGEIYHNVKRYDDAKELLLIAFDRHSIGKKILYRLAEIAIEAGDLNEAQDYYDEFVEVAPNDTRKYHLKYKISIAKKEPIEKQIAILEELRETDDTEEEWAYELAYLYHRAGEKDKCVDLCDQIVIWFGNGDYVEKALDLKMLYEPLTPSQEARYKTFSRNRGGMIEVVPGERLNSGEIINESLSIPEVTTALDKDATINLQKELAKGIKQIMDATERGEVDDTMSSIRKLVDDIPYLQPSDEQAESDARAAGYASDEEIESEINNAISGIFAEDDDGQMRIFVPDAAEVEPQVEGQLTIEDVIADWERKMRAADEVMEEVEARKLESKKAKALFATEDIMNRLAQVTGELPDLSELGLEAEEEPMPEIKVDEEEFAKEFAAYTGQLPVIDEEEAVPSPADELERELMEAEAEFEANYGTLDPSEEPVLFTDEEAQPEQEEPVPYEEQEPEEELQMYEDEAPVEEAEPETFTEPEVVAGPEASKEPEPEVKVNSFKDYEPTAEEEEIEKDPTIPLPDLDLNIFKEPEVKEELEPLKNLSKELNGCFSYFSKITGMEEQLVNALNGVGQYLSNPDAVGGGLIVQGPAGSGKTTLASNFVKALQHYTKKTGTKMGKINGSTLNNKDVYKVLGRVSGGSLIVENAGDLKKETIVSICDYMSSDNDKVLVILEDDADGIAKVISKDEGVRNRFTELIKIPEMSNEVLVRFAEVYAKEGGYSIDPMAILALHARINNIARLDSTTTVNEVKEIVDEAIMNVERGGIKKVFGALSGKRYDANNYVIIREKDFQA
ncbi:MAG: hypothetical protein K6E56_02400 [Lachnospiraceae bacterium]|nr:hypothetical protein [Lachnospiraceae bacterium]